MTRVRLKGINSKTKRLADGTPKTYYWAYRGGPALPGKPGSPEFMQAYHDAHKAKRPTGEGQLLSVLNAYQASSDFSGLAPRTRTDYVKQIRKIETRFHDFPISGLKVPRSRSIFLKWRDDLALTSARQADYAWSVLTRVLAWALNRGLIDSNPTTKAGRLYRATRADKVWTDADEARFLASAPEHLHLPFLLAIWTAQRQGDLLRLPWRAYDGETLHLQQGKTGVRVTIPVAATLKARLDAIRRTDDTPILLSSRGTPWTANGFSVSWRKACHAAGITGLTFHDLPGTAVTRLAVAGASHPQIAALTGHSLADVRDILDKNYLSRDPALAKAAIQKLEERKKISDRVSD